MSVHTRQLGGSAIGLVIILALFACGAFIGIQYVPQYLESNAVDTILDNLVDKNKKEPMDTVGAVQGAIESQLYINEMSDLKESFKVTEYRGDFVIKVNYERELNLIYQTKLMPYEKSVTLK